MREEFPEAIKRALAARVGYRCSREGCDAPTTGPQIGDSKSVNIGVAAHITAASVGGPRYDPALTREQRTSAENGIWLCQNCGKLVDNDSARFTADELRAWKRDAEAAALERIGKPRELPVNTRSPSLRILLRLPWPGIEPYFMEHPVLIVEIQNHGLIKVFGIRFQFEREDGCRLQPRVDALNTAVKNVDLLPGASSEWFISGESLFEFCRNAPITRVLAIDAVDREYAADPGDVRTSSILQSFAQRVRRHFAY